MLLPRSWVLPLATALLTSACAAEPGDGSTSTDAPESVSDIPSELDRAEPAQESAAGESSVEGAVGEAPTLPSGNGAAAPAQTPGTLTALQKLKAEMLTSVWESSSTVLKYEASMNINDGRGYTSGRAGFCTGTGDAVLVVECFDKSVGIGAQNRMHKYAAAMQTLATAFHTTRVSQSSTRTLDAIGNYNDDWARSANEPATKAAFRACQDAVVSKLYYDPTLALAKRWGLTSPLALAALYDANINHGEDGIKALIAQANSDVGNTAQATATTSLSAADESLWLEKFLWRRIVLLRGNATWSMAVDRVALYEQLRRDGHWMLDRTIVTNVKAQRLYPNQGFKDCLYPACTIDPTGSVTGDPICTR